MFLKSHKRMTLLDFGKTCCIPNSTPTLCRGFTNKRRRSVPIRADATKRVAFCVGLRTAPNRIPIRLDQSIAKTINSTQAIFLVFDKKQEQNVPLVFLEKWIIIFSYAPVAQWIMQQISNLWIAGSSPAGRAINSTGPQDRF